MGDQGEANEDSVPSTFDYCIWMICTLLEAAVVVTAARNHAFRRYIFLNIYMGSSFLVSVGRYQVLSRSGLASAEYAYFYYYSDALLTIGLYFALLNLYSLGGQFKSGQLGSGQNRPTEVARNS